MEWVSQSSLPYETPTDLAGLPPRRIFVNVHFSPGPMLPSTVRRPLRSPAGSLKIGTRYGARGRVLGVSRLS